MCTVDWKEYQDLFRFLEPNIWLNHAGVSPISLAVAEAMEEQIRDVLENGWAHGPQWHARLKEAKELASRLLDCDPGDLAATPNTTHGVNLVANGLRWNPGDEIVLCTKEYPANVYPWWAQQAKGARLVWVEPDHRGRFPAEAYAEKITKKTRVLAVSHVQFATGYRHDLQKLGELCRQSKAILFVDAIQSFSVFPIDLRGWGIDALTTGSHKWLLGPTGIALFYATPELRDNLDLTYVGADCMVDAEDYLDYRFELLPDGRRFENAMLNFPGVAGLRAALQVVDRFGRNRIEREIRKATDRLASKLQSLGFEICCSRDGEEWSGILIVDHPALPAQVVAQRLRDRNIATSIRDGRLRLSPHAYFTESAFERIESALDESFPKDGA